MDTKKLSCAKLGKDYKIFNLKMKDEGLKKQLENLGFLKDEKVKLLKYNLGKKSLLIKVMGINYAIDKVVCDEIEIIDV